MKIALITLCLACAAWAQTPSPACPSASSTNNAAISWDNSGDGNLSGPYYFRHVTYSVGDQQGDLNHATALWGTITFTVPGNGQTNGTYSITGMCLDSNFSPMVAQSVTISGTYSIASSGWGFISNPVSSGDVIWGVLSEAKSKSVAGTFVGSSTETQNAFNDLFICAPANSSLTESSVKGAYSVAYLNFPDGLASNVLTAGFQMEPNGSGGIGSVNIEMFTGTSSTPVDLVEPASYSVASATGIGTLSFNSLGYPIGGGKIFYSPDGTFLFGGGDSAFDFFAGVLTQSSGSSPGVLPGFGASAFTGLFYQAGIDEIMPAAAVPNPIASLQTYYGSFEAVSGTILDHQRILAPLGSTVQGPLNPPQVPGCATSPFSSFCPYQPFNYDYVDQYSLGFGSNIGYIDATTGREYVLSEDGSVRLGFGTYPNLGLSVALKAPTSVPSYAAPPGTTPGPYIYPNGIVNSASYAPFTSGISPGELVTIFGSNFTSSTTVCVTPMPTLTTGTASGSCPSSAVPAPVVAFYPNQPTQISVLIPTSLAPGFAEIQAMTPGTSGPSSMIWTVVYPTDVGVATQAADGIGPALAVHASSQLPVTSASPAMVGENIIVYAVGLSAASQSFDGVAIPASTSISVTIGGVAAVVNSIEAPSSEGVSAINVTVPKTTSGVAPLMIATANSTAAQATISVTASSASSSGSGSGGSTTTSGSGTTGSSTTGSGPVSITITVQ